MPFATLCARVFGYRGGPPWSYTQTIGYVTATSAPYATEHTESYHTQSYDECAALLRHIQVTGRSNEDSVESSSSEDRCYYSWTAFFMCSVISVPNKLPRRDYALKALCGMLEGHEGGSDAGASNGEFGAMVLQNPFEGGKVMPT